MEMSIFSQKKVEGITRRVLNMILESSKDAYPNEFACGLRNRWYHLRIDLGTGYDIRSHQCNIETALFTDRLFHSGYRTQPSDPEQ